MIDDLDFCLPCGAPLVDGRCPDCDKHRADEAPAPSTWVAMAGDRWVAKHPENGHIVIALFVLLAPAVLVAAFVLGTAMLAGLAVAGAVLGTQAAVAWLSDRSDR